MGGKRNRARPSPRTSLADATGCCPRCGRTLDRSELLRVQFGSVLGRPPACGACGLPLRIRPGSMLALQVLAGVPSAVLGLLVSAALGPGPGVLTLGLVYLVFHLMLSPRVVRVRGRE